MNWITTNIRFPEEMYMELKLEAAKKRTSVAEIVRSRIMTKNTTANKQSLKERLTKVGQINSKADPKGNWTEDFIKLRYEQ